MIRQKSKRKHRQESLTACSLNVLFSFYLGLLLDKIRRYYSIQTTTVLVYILLDHLKLKQITRLAYLKRNYKFLDREELTNHAEGSQVYLNFTQFYLLLFITCANWLYVVVFVENLRRPIYLQFRLAKFLGNFSCVIAVFSNTLVKFQCYLTFT